MNKPKSPWAGVVEYLDDLVRRVEALEARTIPDPSQPAEQPKPAFKKYCDDCTNSWALPSWRPCKKCEAVRSVQSKPAEPHDDDKVKRSPGCECHLEVGDSPCRVHGEDEEAEPKIEYPLNYEEAMQARDNGHEIASCIGPGKAKARWRIVDGGK